MKKNYLLVLVFFLFASLWAQNGPANQRGYIKLYSEFAGTVLLNGETTQFATKAGEEIVVTVENAKGNEYSVSVRNAGGTVYEAGKITINTTGNSRNFYAMYIFGPNTAPNSGDDFDIKQLTNGTLAITKYRGKKDFVIIPQIIEGLKVTEIDSFAFALYDYEGDKINNPIYCLILPDTITTIGFRAFYRQNINTLIIPNSVTTIHDEAFSGNKIKSLTLGSGIKNIYEGAFMNNDIESLAIPNSLSNIGKYSFAWNELTALSIPASLKTVGGSAFANNKIENLTISNGVEFLGESSFMGNPITTLVIPASLVSKSSKGFYGAFEPNKNGPNITTITLPANVDDFNFYGLNESLYYFYQSQGKKAGTYTLNGRIWTVK